MIVSIMKVFLFRALLPSPALGFSRRSWIVPTTRCMSSGTNIFASTVETNNDASKKTGMEALERLLLRQQADLEETKRLLSLYQTIGNSNSTIMGSVDMQASSELMSIAASVLKGFDYGFQSRSEGPKFDLKGGNQVFVGYGPPANILSLGSQQFMRNLNAMRNEYADESNVRKLWTMHATEVESKPRMILSTPSHSHCLHACLFHK
jgi:hypothetical protein